MLLHTHMVLSVILRLTAAGMFVHLYRLIVVIMMIFLLMPFMLRFSLINRLKLLLEGVKRVNEGDLSTTVEVGLKDEIGLLSENFNNMTHNLKIARQQLTDYALTLEKKVSLRSG